MTGVVVAIDGPAGSGKSSVSRAVAGVLGYDYQDSGAAYRALAWQALQRGIPTRDADAIAASLTGFRYRISLDPERPGVWVGDTEVTTAIREPRVTAVVSDIARVPEVRRALIAIFRNTIAGSRRPGIITEGRDITTVVSPDADVRILLTASEEARMARRSAEVTGQSASDVGRQLSSRDAQDSKVVDFMNAADGVDTVDSTHLDFGQTVSAVVQLVRSRGVGD